MGVPWNSVGKIEIVGCSDLRESAEAGDCVFVLFGRDARAAIFEDHHFVVALLRRGLRLAGAVGRNAGHDDPLDGVGAQDCLKRCRVERADPVLDDVEVLRLGCKRVVDLRAPGAELEQAVLLRAGEDRRIGRGLAVIGRKADPDCDT